MKLTNINLTEDDNEWLQKNLDSIIWFLEQLNAIDTTDIEPLTHPISGHTLTLEEQVPTNCDDPAAYLENIKHRMVNNAIKIKSMLS